MALPIIGRDKANAYFFSRFPVQTGDNLNLIGNLEKISPLRMASCISCYGGGVWLFLPSYKVAVKLIARMRMMCRMRALSDLMSAGLVYFVALDLGYCILSHSTAFHTIVDNQIKWLELFL